MSKENFMLFSCRSGMPLANKIARELGVPISKMDVKQFSNGEFKPIVKESVRGADCYIVQLIDDPNSIQSPADNFWELVEAVDAIHRSNGVQGSITVIMPNFFRARQHKRKDREPLSVRIVADVLEAVGANTVITLDVHSDATFGCFKKIRFENLYFSEYLIKYLNENFPVLMSNREKLAFASVDLGGLERARHYAQVCGASYVSSAKFRDYSKANQDGVQEMLTLGEVEDKNIIVVDDMIDTGGTLVKGLTELKKLGAKQLHFVCTHPIMSGPAKDRLRDAFKSGVLHSIVCADTVSQYPETLNFPVHFVSCAPLLAEVIRRNHNNESLSDLFKGRAI